MVKKICTILVLIILLSGTVSLNSSLEIEDFGDSIPEENMTRGDNTYFVEARGITEYNGFFYLIGDIHIIGSSVSVDALIQKYDIDGNLIWSSRWDSIDYLEPSFYKREYSVDNLIGYNGYLYVLGHFTDYGSAPSYDTNRDIFLLKYDTDGNLIWNATWDGSDSDNGSQLLVQDNVIYITGLSNSESILLSYDIDGNHLWNKTWSASSLDNSDGIILYNGNLFVEGMSNNLNPFSIFAFYLLKYDLDGNLLWNRTLGDYNRSYYLAEMVEYNGYFYVEGSTLNNTYTYSQGHSESFLLKYDENGNLLWNRTQGDENSSYYGSGIVEYNGNLYVVGTLTNYTYSKSGTFLLKYDLDGNLLWNKTWGEGVGEYSTMIVELNGNIYVEGDKTGGTFLLKYDPDGNLLWNTTWGGDAKGIVAYDGNIYITGSTDSSDSGNVDLFLLKYDQDGNLIWNITWGRSEIENNDTHPVIINISMAKQQFSINEPINVTVNITNNRTEYINRSGYCFTFILEHNSTSMELFYPFNITMGIIPPGGNFVQTINLLEYSSNQDSWEKIGNLPAGNYSLKAVYGSQTNPWYDETEIPYNETASNILQFEVISDDHNSKETQAWSWIVPITLIVVSVIVIRYRMKGAKPKESHSQDAPSGEEKKRRQNE